MDKLSYQTLQEAGYDGYLLKEAPERVIQFGEGNFMRAFVDYFIDNMNEKAGFNSKVVLVQPIAPIPGAFDLKNALNEQDGLYTLYLRGCENGDSSTVEVLGQNSPLALPTTQTLISLLNPTAL